MFYHIQLSLLMKIAISDCFILLLDCYMKLHTYIQI